MVPRGALLGEGQRVGAAVVGDGDVALLDVDVGGAVLAHGAQLHQVALGGVVLDGVEGVDGAHDVVGLGEDTLLAAEHGVGRGPLLAEVHHGIGQEALHGLAEEPVVCDVANVEIDLLAGELLPLGHAIVDGRDGGEGLCAALLVHVAADEAVHDGHLVALLGQVQRGGPPAVSITPDDHDALATASGLRILHVDPVGNGRRGHNLLRHRRQALHFLLDTDLGTTHSGLHAQRRLLGGHDHARGRGAIAGGFGRCRRQSYGRASASNVGRHFCFTFY
mmetsp:Transcript_33118/g.55486  ORF Transcript_33118/g.55486 Transcript_33118/m.55486 type:complete len:277 (+) Transcript_33118:1036-1866(+)